MTSPNSLKESTLRSQTFPQTQRAQEEESLTHGERHFLFPYPIALMCHYLLH